MSFYDLYEAINCVTVGQMEGREYWNKGMRGAQNPKERVGGGEQEQIDLT